LTTFIKIISAPHIIQRIGLAPFRRQRRWAGELFRQARKNWKCSK
jgi:hypothetical protein